MKTFIDLFAGIGGFRLALESLGLECVFTSEIDKHAAQAYANHFNDKVNGDITKIPSEYIAEHDILCGGFPCQSFSINGTRDGFGDDRGMLFYEIVRIAEYHKPKVLLLENVRHILSIDDGKVLDAIIKELDDIGYKTHYSVLNASDFGIPQTRLRVYFICMRKDLGLKYKEPFPTREHIYLCDYLENDVDDKYYVTRDDCVIDKSPKDYELTTIRIGEFNIGQDYRIYHPNGHATTLMSKGGGLGRGSGLYLINDRIRRLTLTECKRIMGFPDDYKLRDGTIGLAQLGNAVIPKMIKEVYQGIK